MGHRITITFTIVSGVCSILLFVSFIHFIWGVNQKKKGKSVDSLVKKCAYVSLFGYTTFVILSFILYLIQSFYYIPSINVYYSTLICQAQTFNIVFFMTGKLGMYFYFMSLVHVAFRGSFLAYPVKIIGSMAIMFFFLMCTIGGFYMVFLYIDFSSVGSITSPADCDKFEASQYSTITIWTGATCDAIWSFTCLLLFYLRLRKITKLMTDQTKLERKQTDEMIARIKIKCNKDENDDNHENKKNNVTKNSVIDAEIEIDRNDDIETISIESLPTSGFIGSPPTFFGSKVLKTVNELIPIPPNKHSVTPSPSSSPSPSTPKQKQQQRSDGSTISGGTSIMTISIRTDVSGYDEDMDMDIHHDIDHDDDNDDDDDNDEEEEESSLSTKTDIDIKDNSERDETHIIYGEEYEGDNDETTQTTTQNSEYTLMKHRYQTVPRIVAYDDRRNSQSSSNKMLTSLKLKFDNTSSKLKKKIKRRNSWNSMRKRKPKKKKPDIVHKFLPIMLKLSILSAWCAFSTFGLGFGLWTIYPTLSSVIDSTINAFCIYLSFGFTKPLYELLCSPFISCRNCENYRNVVNEANKMENDKTYNMEETVLG